VWLGSTGYDQRAGQPDYPALAAYVQVSGIGRGCANRTRVQIEVTPLPGDAAGPAARTLEAVLTGCESVQPAPARLTKSRRRRAGTQLAGDQILLRPGDSARHGGCADCGGLGLMIGRNASTGRPIVQTFREYNRRQYWDPLDALGLAPLARPPRHFPLMDSLRVCSHVHCAAVHDAPQYTMNLWEGERPQP
jgi:hypothetical protein